MIAGFIFSFSSYHFAHVSGHLNLIAIYWLPVFLLAWMKLLDRPTRRMALAAAAALLLVTFSDYYYALYGGSAPGTRRSSYGDPTSRRWPYSSARRLPPRGRLRGVVAGQ
jgi:hypothetical protein